MRNERWEIDRLFAGSCACGVKDHRKGCLDPERKDHGLLAAVFGGAKAETVADASRREDCCHPVTDHTFGKLGTIAY